MMSLFSLTTQLLESSLYKGPYLETQEDLNWGKKSLPQDSNRIIIQSDSVGQERFRAVTRSCYKTAQGIILVYDVTDRKSFESIQYWMDEVDQ